MITARQRLRPGPKPAHAGMYRLIEQVRIDGKTTRTTLWEGSDVLGLRKKRADYRARARPQGFMRLFYYYGNERIYPYQFTGGKP